MPDMTPLNEALTNLKQAVGGGDAPAAAAGIAADLATLKAAKVIMDEWDYGTHDITTLIDVIEDGLPDHLADHAGDESASTPFVEEDTRYPANDADADPVDDDPAHVAEGDRVRDPFDGTWRTVARIDGDTAYLTDGGCMNVDECRDIRLPGEALD